MQKNTIDHENPAIGNVLLAADFISETFSKHIDMMFEKLGADIFDKRLVQKYTKVYYVKMDLESGIEISAITKDRLDPFHSVLWAYIGIIDPHDEKAVKLFDIVDEALSKICS